MIYLIKSLIMLLSFNQIPCGCEEIQRANGKAEFLIQNEFGSFNLIMKQIKTEELDSIFVIDNKTNEYVLKDEIEAHETLDIHCKDSSGKTEYFIESGGYMILLTHRLVFTSKDVSFIPFR